MKKKVEPNPALCFDGLNKTKIQGEDYDSTEEKDEKAELVKLFRTVFPGELVKVLGNGIQSIIETELSSILVAELYQRVEGKTNYRNGYRERKEPLSIGIGPVNLSIPKLRSGSFYPSILEHYQRVDRA